MLVSLGLVSFQKLLSRAREGDIDALGELLERHAEQLKRDAQRLLPKVLRRKIGDSDFVQETCRDAQKKLRDFKGNSHEEFVGWLRRSLRNKVISYSRRLLGGKRDARRERGLIEVGHLLEFALREDSYETRREQLERVDKALRALRRRDAQILVSHLRDGWTFARLGRAFACSEEAARKVFSRARRQLLQILREGSERSPL